jgi:hypothetical protein
VEKKAIISMNVLKRRIREKMRKKTPQRRRKDPKSIRRPRAKPRERL